VKLEPGVEAPDPGGETVKLGSAIIIGGSPEIRKRRTIVK
jgi:hypothetical protein